MTSTLPSAPTAGRREGSPAEARPGENQLIWTVWLTYGAFYFCRTNLSAALPGIESELGIDKAQMGMVLMGLKFAYGAGQFVNGQLSERISARTMLAIGMLGSAALNVLFGFGTGLYFFLFVWAMNGYVQSMGWTPCVRVIGNWIPVLRRGRAIGIVGTGYQVTAGLTYLVSGVSVWFLGWRGALWIPPMILIAASLVMLLFLRETPEDHAQHTNGERPDEVFSSEERTGGGFLTNLGLTLSNPALWLLALSLGMLNANRYGFVDWGISHLVAVERARTQHEEIERLLGTASLTPEDRGRLEVLRELDLVDDTAQKRAATALEDGLLSTPARSADRWAVVMSAMKYAVLPIGAIFGSFLAGWATDRFFGGRRAPVIIGLLVILGGFTLIYDEVARASFGATIALLLAIGFCIYGPQVLLVGTAPADLAREGTAAAAAGFVNCVGYVGAALAGDLLTGYLADNYGWKIAIYFWALWAFVAAALMVFLWNASGMSSASSQADANDADRPQ